MTVLITGGAGYIGSHMAWLLDDCEENFIILDDLSTGHKSAIPPEAPFYEGDIGDEKLLSKILTEHEVDSVIHFAGSIVVPESVQNPLKYYQNNTVNSRSLIESAVKHSVRNFIFASTAVVYDTPEIIPISEREKLDPVSPYGTSKMMTELMLKDAAKAYGLSYIILRYFNVAGADPKGRTGQSTPNATHLIKVSSQAALGLRSEVQVFGSDYATKDGTGIRDYIHVSDLVQAHKLALDYLRDGGRNRTMNCGYGRGYSVLDIISTLKKVSGIDFPVKYTKRRSGDPEKLIADPTQIKKILNWVPQHDNIEEIALTALNWEKAQR